MAGFSPNTACGAGRKVSLRGQQSRLNSGPFDGKRLSVFDSLAQSFARNRRSMAGQSATDRSRDPPIPRPGANSVITAAAALLGIGGVIGAIGAALGPETRDVDF
jgi:hypothetical protein